MKKAVYKRSRSEERGVQTNFPRGFHNLAGEVYIDKHQVIYACPFNERKIGVLYLTNYRLYFQPIGYDCNIIKHLEVLLGTILKITKVHKDQKSCLVNISCKDIRKVYIEFEKCPTSKIFIEKLTFNCFPLSFGIKAFAFNYSEVFPENGWKLYNPVTEFERMGIKTGDENAKWRVTYVNRNYMLCDTYPAILAVPGLKDNELELVAKFRSKGRLPVLSWIHKKNFSTITRCSQPLCGVIGNRSAEDERYINVIRCAHSFQHKLTIADCRPLTNAMMNKAKGGGFETSNAYPGVEIIFLNIPNIHVMRDSLIKLKSLCLKPPIQDRWFSSLESTMWLKYIKQVLSGAMEVVDRIKDDNSVVVHCSDGWDRTSQITSLAMFMLDPYYRTIKGFEVLIEKEWLSFGHKFQQRYGHGDVTCENQERSPIFVQFIDCIWQIQQQFPTATEFNERFLLTILDHLYSCRFGTFMCNTERQREIEVKNQTISLWSWMNSSIHHYKNKSYLYSQHDVLNPIVTMHYIGLWKKYYCQWNPSGQEENSSIQKPEELANTQVVKATDKSLVSKVLKSILKPFDNRSEPSTSTAQFHV